MQEVPSLDQVLKEMDFNGLLHCGKKETQSDSGHSALPTHKKENVKHQKPKENSFYIAEIRTRTFITSLLQVQRFKKMHLQDTSNNKASPLIHEQEGIKDKCSRSSNAICGSLPLNKKLITNNLCLTAAISLCLTSTDSNLINLH